MKQISSLIIAFAMFGVIFSVLPSVYSQTTDIETSDQTTISGDLLNNPMAQEILKKIEESKRKIAKLEQQNYDNLQAQKFLEDRRAVALERLNQALTLWEEEWYEFSPKVAYQKFIDKMSSGVQGIYAKQFEFTETKHELGTTAKSRALDNGLDSPKALQKFNSAARSTVQELHNYNKIIQPDTPSEIATKIAILEGRVNTFNHNYFNHYATLKGVLSAKYAVEVENERNEIKDLIKEYDSDIISREELTTQLGDVREKYAPIKENIQSENSELLLEYETKQMRSIQYLMDDINNDDSASSVIKAEWNAETNSIDIVRK